MNDIFNYCVRFLVWLGDFTGTTYKEINVIIFCVIWPAVTVWLLWKVKKLRERVRELESGK